ncbi:MAG: deoxyribodipyrimidine photolyase [Myxococcaceae bacterium]|nr:deoxyribodipyrimidine photolyase [Myxococcaceae bacterium]
MVARGSYVLYWMTAARRLEANFALDRAIELAREKRRPLLIFEALRCDYRWASDRLHQFILEGMEVNRRKCKSAGVTYFSYVEPRPGAGKGLLEMLAHEACAVVTDDAPMFFLSRMRACAAARIEVCLEAVDSNGLYPMWATEKVFPTAFSFRTHLQKTLRPHLDELPLDQPFERLTAKRAPLPEGIEKRWPSQPSLPLLPIDHTVGPAAFTGGSEAAQARLKHFLQNVLPSWPDSRNQPEVDGSSRLSPYLHFGHIGSHQVFAAVAKQEDWTPAKLGKSNGGKKIGWWKMSPQAEAFVDQSVTWREIGFNFASHRSEAPDDYETLPRWALATLAKHENDPRPVVYSTAQLDEAQTHDLLWNASMNQLKREGWMHGYLRMLWGKKILEWSATPREALKSMEQLMNRYAVDGRDPNSYSGIFWVLGRYDRPWGPERKIFGTVRYMSSANTAKKVQVTRYIENYQSPLRSILR